MVQLWSYKKGVFKRTVRIDAEMILPVTDLLKLQGRYADLSESDIKDLEAHIDRKNKLVDALEGAFKGPETVSW
jgi:hypothetical protein